MLYIIYPLLYTLRIQMPNFGLIILVSQVVPVVEACSV